MEANRIFARQGEYFFHDVVASGRAARPLEFPAPQVHDALNESGYVINVETGERSHFRNLVFKMDTDGDGPQIAYLMQRRLVRAIYGYVWLCIVLRRHHGPAADEILEVVEGQAPYVWEVTRERVAIKMMVWSRIQRGRGRMLEDPVKEIAAMQLLSNNNNDGLVDTNDGGDYILKVSEVLTDDNFLYQVLPFCAGGDLFGIVVQYADASDGAHGMPEPVARYWFRQILKGLQYLQSKGVCHRDLSLENILVHEDNCFIIDMGMCLRVPYSDLHDPSITTDVTNGGMRRLITPQGTCGKLNYMAPEIFANSEPFDGFAIDLWSTGVILYIMLTGFPPYDQATLADPRFESIVNGRLVAQLEEWGVHLSQEVGNLLQNMLQLDPSNRLTLNQVMRHPWVTANEIERPVNHLEPWQRGHDAH